MDENTEITQAPPKTVGEKLQSFPRWALYLLLIVATAFPLFFPVNVPNKPTDEAIDFYASLMAIPDGSRVLISSDWTGSTRGESGGSFESMVKILMRKNIKFGIYSTGDPQAPQVARDAVAVINAERKKNGERVYKRFEDWVSLGYFANSEGTTGGIGNNIRAIFSGVKDYPEGRPPTPVLESPVFKDVNSIADFKMLILVTASKTADIIVERLYGKIPLAFQVTGVMVPETRNYYTSKQISGLIGGLKGVYDLEQMMEYGVNYPDKATAKIKSDKYDTIPGFPGQANKGKGTLYYPTLHVAIVLLILTVVIGNLGMLLSRRGAK
jgi:hypothetical protein